MGTLSSRNRYMPSTMAQKERRQSPRAEGEIPVVIMTMRGPMAARMTDLSLTGCRIRCTDLPNFALSVRISIAGHGLDLRAEQRWRRGEDSGWRFIYSDREQERLKEALHRIGRMRNTAETIVQPFRSSGR